jgi:hypothetical protein
MAALSPRVPQLTIVIVERSSQARLSIDDEELPLAKTEAPIPLNPGRHIVSLSVPGHDPATYTVTLAEGQSRTLTVRPGRANGSQRTSSGVAVGPNAGDAQASSDEAQPGADGSAEGSTKRTAGYVALGAGGLGLVVGTVTGILVLTNKSTMESHCDQNFACDSEGLDAASAGQTFSTISTVSFVVAAAGAGLGAYLLLSDDADEGSRTGLAFTPSANGAEVTVRHEF